MIKTASKIKEELNTGATTVNYADIVLNDGTVINLEPENFMLSGCSIEDKTTDGKFGVGFTIGKTLFLRIANHEEQFTQYDFYSSIINLYIETIFEDGTIDKIRKGVYYTIVPETPGDIIEISAVDGMYKFDKEYTESKTKYPASLLTILTDACLDCGIPAKFREFDNMHFVVQEKPENVTYRQVVSYVCQIAGYNARIDNDGYLELVWYDTESEIPIEITYFKSLNVHTDDVIITGVQVVNGETSVLFGDTGYTIKIESNPFVAGKEQEVADYLGARMVGVRFRPFNAQIPNNPLYEPFEVCNITDRKGNVYRSIINSVSYQVGGYTGISCEAEDPVRNGSMYVSAAAQAVAEARKNAQKYLSEYDKAVQNMTEIAMNTMGYFTTNEKQTDGSIITYVHDKTDLQDSTTIYKKGIDGFFISTDGGKSYTAGFDKNGNAVLNILSVIGLSANWITAGRILVKDDDGNIKFLVDIDTNEVIINADRISIGSKSVEEIAKETVDGIEIGSENLLHNSKNLIYDGNFFLSSLLSYEQIALTYKDKLLYY